MRSMMVRTSALVFFALLLVLPFGCGNGEEMDDENGHVHGGRAAFNNEYDQADALLAHKGELRT